MVLILILLEYGLQLNIAEYYNRLHTVLILILLEYGLQRRFSTLFVRFSTS